MHTWDLGILYNNKMWSSVLWLVCYEPMTNA